MDSKYDAICGITEEELHSVFAESIHKMAENMHCSYEAQYFMDYRADVEDPLAMLYQSGYLTIKDYDFRDMVYTLDFPLFLLLYHMRLIKMFAL